MSANPIGGVSVLNNKLNILIKCVTLLYREIHINRENDGSDFSTDLVSSVLATYNGDSNNKPAMGNSALISDGLVDFCHKLINGLNNYSEEDIIDTMSLLLKDDKSLLANVTTTLAKELTMASLKRSVVSLRLQLKSFVTETTIKKKILKCIYDFNNTPQLNIIEYTKSLLMELDLLASSKGDSIPGIVSEIDIEDDSMEKVLQSVKDLTDNTSRLVTGWKELNTMLQGGYRRGETCVINALQHEYKSGLVQSLFMQIPMYNVPRMIDATKKPLVLYISFEDDAEVFGGFMYKYLYSSEHGTLPDLTDITPAEIQEYMKEKLKINGYHIKMLRVNPSEWTYKELFNYIIYLESQGYEIHACLVDYLIKMSVAGCVGKGGTEYRDLFDKCRQFFSVKKITFITPHQMSTEAKQLVRNGTNKLNLVKEVVNKGYTELSKQIDQVVDIEICIAKALLNKRWVLTMMIGKHRGAGIIPDEHKYQILQFPTGMPIPPNINNDDYKPITSTKSDEDDLFAM